MSSMITAAKRRRSTLLASSFLVPIICLTVPAAHAQLTPPPDQLPAIEVTPPKPVERNRVEPSPEWASRIGRITRAPTVQPSPAPQPAPGRAAMRVAPAAPAPPAAPNILAGASTTVISAEEIAHSPAQTVQEIVAQVPGVQLTSLFGGVNGAQTTVDLRGFGATAVSNTLILINGRRVNDIDMQGVDLSTIPRDSIERIEITKGNSGAVLYGDNAM